MTNQKVRSNQVLTYQLSEPLPNSTQAVKVGISNASGNLTIDPLDHNESLLASGTLEYTEKQGPPIQTTDSSHGQTTFTLNLARDTGRSWFRMPWAACNAATDWQIHLNPTVPMEIKARSGGGNVRLDLTGMVVSHLDTDTGGGNIDLLLPDQTVNLSVNAKTGAGNVTIQVPAHIAARIQATSGLGKVIVDPQFTQIEEKTYQTSGNTSADCLIEIKVATGAGNVIVSSKI